MYANQFINLWELEDVEDLDVVIPIYNFVSFFFTQADATAGARHTFDLVSAENTSVVLQRNISSSTTIASGKGHVALSNLGFTSLRGKCARIRLTVAVGENEDVYYSNIVKVMHPTDALTSLVEYWCDEDTFGIPFATMNKHIKQYLPILLRDPQLATKEEVYEKLNGEKVVLYSTIKKEHTLETDYIPEEWHDKLVVALSCDHVKINDVSVHKDGDYTIDWEKCRLVGNTRTAKGEAKIQQNFNSRNSN